MESYKSGNDYGSDFFMNFESNVDDYLYRSPFDSLKNTGIEMNEDCKFKQIEPFETKTNSSSNIGEEFSSKIQAIRLYLLNNINSKDLSIDIHFSENFSDENWNCFKEILLLLKCSFFEKNRGDGKSLHIILPHLK